MEVLNTTTLDADPEVDRLRTEVHPRHRIAVVPATRNEWLDRKSQLWSLVQSVNPAKADLTAVTEEKAALDAFNGAEI